MERAQNSGQIQVSGCVPTLVEIRRGLDCSELGVSENGGMTMKRESRQSVELLLVGESAVRAERAAAAGESLEERLALAELHPFFGGQSRSDWISRFGHSHLFVRVVSNNNLIRQMSAHPVQSASQPTRAAAQVTKIQA